ncbi:MAG: chorismate synthase [Candidatus Omnitrophica bacterium]|nr:chorismate synthase [Candidatus Omnitrophota bacterium]
MLRYLTAGESHGECLVATVEGMPAGLKVDVESIDRDMELRQQGYGRGARMKIEKDRVHFLSGLRSGVTIGSPIAIQIENKDNTIDRLPPVFEPRPGHADLSGALKYGHRDIRSVLERASARETAARVAVGSLAKCLLKEFGISVHAYVVMIGGIWAKMRAVSAQELARAIGHSLVRCPDRAVEKKIISAIDKAKAQGNTLGGAFEIRVTGAPVGLGSFVQWDRKLDGRLARALMSVQTVKAVEMGLGIRSSQSLGSESHDEIFWTKSRGFYRKTESAGGIEGGMSNGEDIVMRAYLKPIATLKRPLRSVDVRTKKPVKATYQRSDVCTVPAASVIGEAVVAFEMADALCEKIGGDSIHEMMRNYKGYLKQVHEF